MYYSLVLHVVLHVHILLLNEYVFVPLVVVVVVVVRFLHDCSPCYLAVFPRQLLLLLMHLVAATTTTKYIAVSSSSLVVCVHLLPLAHVVPHGRMTWMMSWVTVAMTTTTTTTTTTAADRRMTTRMIVLLLTRPLRTTRMVLIFHPLLYHVR